MPERIRVTNYIQDRFYGPIEFDKSDLRFFQTAEISRLRHVSHSAVPTWTLPIGTCATKFEHSVGVLHLARITSKKTEFRDIARNLQLAALAHDMATPPFSHASEYFLVELFGQNHEVFIHEVMEGSEFAKEAKRQGADLEVIMDLITGEGQFGDLINGSIDLDNLDTSLRYAVSVGLIQDIPYSPERLAEAFGVVNGKLSILPGHLKDIKKWEEVRKRVYKFVYSHANLSPGMMLSRALEFARRRGKLTKDYFRMTDEQAFGYLASKCGPITAKIVEQLDRWQLYSQVYSFSTTRPTDTITNLFLDSANRTVLADRLSDRLHIPPEEVSVYMGKDKGFKQIHLPILGRDKHSHVHQPTQELRFMCQVYVQPKWEGKTAEIADIMDEELAV